MQAVNGVVHGKHSPSSIDKKEECPGWISGDGGVYSNIGDLVHDTISRLIEGRSVPAGRPDDVLELAQVGYDYFLSLKERFPLHQWFPEISVSTGIPGCYGTADLVGYDDFGGEVVVVVDWKTGHGARLGTRRNAADSHQMKCYAAGALHKFPADKILLQLVELEAGDSTEAEHDASEVPGWIDEVKTVIARVETATVADYRPFSGCDYCGRITCPAVQALAVRTTDDLVSAPADPGSLDPSELAPMLDKYLPAFDVIDGYVGKLKARAIALLEAGAEVPGWELSSRAGARKWEDEAAVGSALTSPEIPGICLSAGMASPAVIEKRLVEAGLKKKDAAALLKPLTRQGYSRSLKQCKVAQAQEVMA